MNTPKMFIIRWDGFVSNAVSELKRFQNENEFFDVTVVAGDGKKVQANKLVLAAASSFFFKILEENPQSHPLIYLGGVSSQMLQHFMDFMYTGEVRIHPDDANDFIDIAVDLRLEGMIGIPASEKTGGDKIKSCSTTSNPRKKRVTFEEPSPAPNPPIPPGVSFPPPATHQNHVSGVGHSPSHPQTTASIPNTFCLSPKHSHPRVLTSRTPGISPEKSPSHATTSTPDLSSPKSATSSTPALHQGLTSITPVLRHRRHTGDSSGLSAQPQSVHKVKPSPQRQTAAEGAPVTIATPPYCHSTFPEATSEENQGSIMFKVEVGPANDYNVHYDKNENGELLISRFSERRRHKNIGREYKMIPAREQDDQVAGDRTDNRIKECYVKIEKIKSSKTGSQKCNVVPKHIRIQNQLDVVLHKCKMCQYTTKNKNHLKTHVEAEHDGVLHKCKMCKYETKYKQNLSIHMKAEHEGLVYACKECNYKAKYKRNLSNHIQAEHEGVLHYCERCTYKATRKGNLTRHIQAEHEGVRHFCKRCNFKAKYQGDLKRHIKVEHEGRRYYCKKCNYMTKNTSHLSRHMQAKH